MATQAELTLLLKAKDEASGQIDKVKGKLGGLGSLAGKALKVGLIAGVGGAVALGAGLFKLGADFDKAFDKIKVGTGATGEVLDQLKGDFKNVFKGIPTDMESASDAVTQFNTLTGATGPALVNMAKSGLEAARLLGEDSAALIANAGKAFNVFEIGADAANGVLDAVFTASQKSNVPMTKLLGTLQTYGPVLKNLGFGIAESTAFFASLEKAGIDVSRVMPGLNAFMRKLSDEGVTDLSGALDEQIEKIKGAKTESEALNLATQAFGAEGAQRLSVAIRTGALDLDEFTKSLVNSEGAILDTAKETESIGEKFTRFKNTLIVGVQPAASAVFDGLGKLADLIATKVVPAIGVFINLFKGGFGGGGVTSKGFPGQIERLGILVKKVIDKAIPIIEKFRDGFIKFAKDALPHIIDFGRVLLNVGREVIPILADAAGELLRGLRQVFEEFIEPVVIPILEKLGKFLLDNKIIFVALGAIIAVALVGPILLVIAAIVLFLAKWDDIKTLFTKTIPDAITSVIDKIKELPVIGEIFEATMEVIKIIVTTVFEIIKNRIETAINVIKDIIDIVMALIRGDWDEVWNGIKQLVSDIWTGIKTEIDLILGTLLDLIGVGLDLIAGVFSDIWNEIKDTVIGLATGLKDEVVDAVTDLKDDALRLITDLKDGAIGLVVELKDRFIRGWTNIATEVFDLVSGLKTDIERKIAETRDAVIDAIAAVPGLLAGLGRDFGRAAFDLGRDLIGGLKSGIDTGLFLVKGAINSILGVIEFGINQALDGIADNVSVLKSLLDAIPGPNPLGNTLQSAINALRTGISIPRLEHGAFIPPGVVTPAILHGGRFGEIVAPLNKVGGLRPIELHVHVHSKYPPTREALEEEVRESILPEVRRQLEGGLA